jgi:hypothetical protein
MARYSIQSLWDVFLTIVGLFGGGLAGIFILGISRRARMAAERWPGPPVALLPYTWFSATRICTSSYYAAAGIVTSVPILGERFHPRRAP